jgi:hypothetical protein
MRWFPTPDVVPDAGDVVPDAGEIVPDAGDVVLTLAI